MIERKRGQQMTIGTIIAILLGIFYGIADEIHQMFVPGRISSISDVIMDSIGSVFGVMYSSYLVSMNKREDSK